MRSSACPRRYPPPTAGEGQGLHKSLTGEKKFIFKGPFSEGAYDFPSLFRRVGFTFSELGFVAGSMLFLLVCADPAVNGYSWRVHVRRSRVSTSRGEK